METRTVVIAASIHIDGCSGPWNLFPHVSIQSLLITTDNYLACKGCRSVVGDVHACKFVNYAEGIFLLIFCSGFRFAQLEISSWGFLLIILLMNKPSNRGRVISPSIKVPVRSVGQGNCLGDEQHTHSQRKGTARDSENAAAGDSSLSYSTKLNSCPQFIPTLHAIPACFESIINKSGRSKVLLS